MDELVSGDLLDWMSSFGPMARVGVEGTGAYGAGLARYLHRQGVMVIEVDRANCQVRCQQGKSDPADAVEAARAVQSGRARGLAKSRDGNVEAIRALLVTTRSARQARIKTLCQIRHLVRHRAGRPARPGWIHSGPGIPDYGRSGDCACGRCGASRR